MTDKWPFANPAMGDVLQRNRYGLILLDPPWSYLTYSGAGTPHRTAVDHYEVMSIDDLKNLPVQDLAAPDCVMLMWVIGSHLDQALDLGKHYGFTYKTDCFVWVKTGKNNPSIRPIGLGKWSRKQTEYTLLFSRGSPSRLDAAVRQLIETDEHIIYAPKREHSRKPDEITERARRLCSGPYVELFARERKPGWSAWGNEVGKFDRSRIICDDPEINYLLGIEYDLDLVG